MLTAIKWISYDHNCVLFLPSNAIFSNIIEYTLGFCSVVLSEKLLSQILLLC